MTGRPRLKVVAALHLSQPGGPSRSLLPVLARLTQRADVVTAVPGPGRAAMELHAVGRVVSLGHEALTIPAGARDAVMTAVRLRADARRFRTLLRREQAGLAIIATTTLPALTLAAWLERVPTVLYAAELDAGPGVRRRARRAVVRLNARLADVTVSCSEAVAAQLPSGVASVVAYPPIDGEADGDAEALRRRHGLPSDRPVLAMIGNIARGRAQDVAIRALRDLRRDHPQAQLLIAGEPHPRADDLAYAQELARLVAALGLGGCVHFCGFERPGDVFAACDVVVNPSRSETFGRVAMEALVAGRPVVCTAVGAVPEVLVDDRHALFVAPGRPEALAAAVRRLLTDRDLSTRLVADGRAHVLSTFSAERQLPRFEQAIAAALDRPATTGRVSRRRAGRHGR